MIIGPTPYRNKPPDVAIVITFARPFTVVLDAQGDYQYLITSHVSGDPLTLGEYEVTKAAASLTITPRNDTQDFDVTIIPYAQASLFAGVEVLSKNWKMQDIYIQAARDIKI